MYPAHAELTGGLSQAYNILRDNDATESDRLNALAFLGKNRGAAPDHLFSELPIASNEDECHPGLDFRGLGISSFTKILTDIDLSHNDFSNAEFSGVALRGVNLKCARLDHVSFRGATLDGVDLSHSNMYAVDVTGSKGDPLSLRFTDANIVHPYVVTNDTNHPIPEYLEGVAQSFLRCKREQGPSERFDIFWDAACTISYPTDGYQVRAN